MKGERLMAGESSFFEQAWLGILSLFGVHMLWTSHFDKVQNEKDHVDLWNKKADKEVLTLVLEEMRSSREERQREAREDRTAQVTRDEALRRLILDRTGRQD
jgi:hypothetical protein